MSTADDAEPALLTVVRLLVAAAHLAETRAEEEGSSSAWHLHGLGALIAASQAAALIGRDVHDPNFDVTGRVPAGTDPLAVLQAAEAACRSMPIDQWPRGASSFVVMVGDLVREWTSTP